VWTNALANAELFDPATNSWTITGRLQGDRSSHTATLLPDGEVLVAGGGNDEFVPQPLAEVYDPASGIWTQDRHTRHCTQWTYCHLAAKRQVSRRAAARWQRELYDPA
jgi:hypothetical protein